MAKRVSLIPFLVIAAALTVGFLWFHTKLDENIQDANAQYQQACIASNNLETEQNHLKTMLATVNTDAFIENQARTLYDYMKPDEIRIVITNPEVLYGPEGK